MRIFSFIAFILLISLPAKKLASGNALELPNEQQADVMDSNDYAKAYIEGLYKELKDNRISEKVFKYALTGLANLMQEQSVPRPQLLTVVDFSKPSSEERLFVIDLQNAAVIFSSLVAHGRNTGGLKALHFSNQPQSYQSSLGFYLTAETYIGKHGFSLRLDGLEQGVNDKARERAVVMHGAEYASERFLNQHGRLGRSLGCPALPPELATDVIKTIAQGSLLFIYADDWNYLNKSACLQQTEPDCLLDALAFME